MMKAAPVWVLLGLLLAFTVIFIVPTLYCAYEERYESFDCDDAAQVTAEWLTALRIPYRILYGFCDETDTAHVWVESSIFGWHLTMDRGPQTRQAKYTNVVEVSGMQLQAWVEDDLIKRD